MGTCQFPNHVPGARSGLLLCRLRDRCAADGTAVLEEVLTVSERCFLTFGSRQTSTDGTADQGCN